MKGSLRTADRMPTQAGRNAKQLEEGVCVNNRNSRKRNISRRWLIGILLCGLAAAPAAGAREPAFTATPLMPVVSYVSPDKTVSTQPSFLPSTGTVPAACRGRILRGSTPGGGYLPLSAFGIAALSAGDDVVLNFNVPAFLYHGQTYATLGVSSNGYVIAGGATGKPDNAYLNQALPDPARPNDVIAPFWTDLDPTAGGNLRIGTLTDGTSSWIVVDWDSIREYSSASTDQFELWIGYNGSEDITVGYGTMNGSGAGGLATVGFEDDTGTTGRVAYRNGFGTAPVNGTQYRFSSCTDTIFDDGYDF